MDASKPLLKSLGPGIVTVNEWLMAHDGATYMYFWSWEWFIGNEKEVLGMVARGNSGFFIKSRYDAIIIPGCRFSSFVARTEPPIPKGLAICVIDKL